MAWQRVAAVADVKPDNPVPVTLGDKQVAIYKLGDSLYCLDDVCPHAYALMSSGFVDGERIECPLHQAAFEIRTGKCVAPRGGTATPGAPACRSHLCTAGKVRNCTIQNFRSPLERRHDQNKIRTSTH